LKLVEAGGMLSPEQLSGIAAFLTTCGRMISYLKKAALLESMVSSHGAEMRGLTDLRDEIERCIRVDIVEDSASPELRNIRRRMGTAKDAVKSKLESMLRTHKDWFSESFVVTRGDRYALPVKRQHKQQVAGTVLDTSSSGGTVFIEPTAARKLTDEIAGLQIAEENEVRRILYALTAEVEAHLGALLHNVSIMESLDFLFAKAKLSAAMRAVEPEITTERRIIIRAGRHPLLDETRCVPLDFEIGGDVQGVIITGPNTGGKTVSLKTVGLLSMMAQSGLHVPVAPGSVFAMHANVLCDIGDGQSISENLSTFSAHMTNIIGILGETSTESLVLLDELGSGTDPAEGMGLAVAILEELRALGCLFVTTSHYPEIKEYAENTPGLLNARMAFDRESLAPLYRLQMGAAGESCALYIAQRLGFPAHMLDRARDAAYAAEGQKPSGGPSLVGATLTPDPRRRTASQVQKHIPVSKEPRACDAFRRGDSVTVLPQKDIGIVFRTADDKGFIGVQIHGEKAFITHKRLKLLVPAEALYPEDYDFSIVFDSVANRKARHRLDKGNPNGVIVYEDGVEA
ncbi:DNA mismatch repair protein MutS, partial [Eubacteriales bacterium OttesenSCG-928-A19]|nr:DNA mismatch repair protein MutS [Eubacteriales bacterium OttesenSCG-928-A19]